MACVLNMVSSGEMEAVPRCDLSERTADLHSSLYILWKFGFIPRPLIRDEDVARFGGGFDDL